MKKILFITLFLSITIISCEQKGTTQNKQNEIIFVVEMNANEKKSSEEIAQFSKYYTDEVNKNEPNTLGWGFYNSGDKTILIERYLNNEAMMQHGKNISEGGPLEAQFAEFMEHFTINKSDVYGNASDELKEFVKPFGLPFYFNPALAKYSRN